MNLKQVVIIIVLVSILITVIQTCTFMITSRNDHDQILDVQNTADCRLNCFNQLKDKNCKFVTPKFISVAVYAQMNNNTILGKNIVKTFENECICSFEGC